MHELVKQACEEIDAAIFSGEGLYDEDLMKYIARWDHAGMEHQDTEELPHDLLFARASDCALRYCDRTGPNREAETVIEVTVLHTGSESLVTGVRADTRLTEPTFFTIGGRR